MNNEEKNFLDLDLVDQIFDNARFQALEKIEDIKNDDSPLKNLYEQFSQKRIEILDEIANNWSMIKTCFSLGEIDKAEVLIDYCKLLSKFEEEFSVTSSDVVFIDKNIAVKTDKGIRHPVRPYDKDDIDCKYRQISSDFEKAVECFKKNNPDFNSLQKVEDTVSKSFGR